MSISDAVFPFILIALVFLGLTNGCDRTRLKLLEDNCREYHKRIFKLEMDVLDLQYNPKWRYNIRTKGDGK